jgi:hypothetical protein
MEADDDKSQGRQTRAIKSGIHPGIPPMKWVPGWLILPRHWLSNKKFFLASGEHALFSGNEAYLEK